ncbi:hypothetical protein [Clostridium sp. OS1-26]|nr:hypothetical protein [Clostridium sp. OS1-26]WML33697.1 hypothetical protein RCG18_20485 [Clostridium sp. OS1-26]
MNLSQETCLVLVDSFGGEVVNGIDIFAIGKYYFYDKKLNLYRFFFI